MSPADIGLPVWMHKKGEVIEWRLDNIEVAKLPPDHLSGEPVDYKKW